MTTILFIASERVGARSATLDGGVLALVLEGDLRREMNMFHAPPAATA